MGNVVAFESVTLDGVMQAPGRPDEDRRGGFEHGGWAARYADEESGRMASEGMASNGGLLFGRRTYEDFYEVWPNRTDNPFTEILDKTPKYVASRTLADPLPWQNSTLLDGEASKAVAKLKRDVDGDFVVLGSGELVRSLLRDDLVDRFILLIHPFGPGVGAAALRRRRSAYNLRAGGHTDHVDRRAPGDVPPEGRLASDGSAAAAGGCATHEGS